MQVLIVDCWEKSHFPTFKRMVKRSLTNLVHGEGSIINFLVRPMDELSDFICHWHHDTLDEKSKSQMTKFDKLDIIFICGDMKMVPWDPMYMQVVTLVFMAHHCHKPLFCCGSAAYAAVYTIATQGSRFHVLNSPHGDSIDNLPSFPRYSFGSGPFPSGWLDNHTGDMYVYEKERKQWRPICNIAMYRIATSGRPTNSKVQLPTKHFARESRKLLAAVGPEAIEHTEQVCFVKNEFLQHYSVRNLASQEFVASPLQEWHLNSEGALPPGCGLKVIACAANGPVLLACDFMLMVALDMSAKSGAAIIETTVDNFCVHVVRALRSGSGDVNRSLFVHIFGEHGLGGGKFDSVLDSKPLSPPLASKCIRSILPRGPTHLDTPVYGMFFKEVDPGTFDLTALMSPRTSSSVGRAPVNVLRDPQMNHSKRMTTLLKSSGYRGLDKVCEQALGQGQATEMNTITEGFLDSTKAAMSGRIIHTHNIRERRTLLVVQSEDSSSGLARPAVKGAVQGASTFILSSPAQMKSAHLSRDTGRSSEDDAGVPMNQGMFGPQFDGRAATADANVASQRGADLESLSAAGNGPASRRPSSASAFVPRHHPKIRRASSAHVPSLDNKYAAMFPEEEEEQDLLPDIHGHFQKETNKFVQPTKTVYLSQKAVSRKSSTVSQR